MYLHTQQTISYNSIKKNLLKLVETLKIKYRGNNSYETFMTWYIVKYVFLPSYIIRHRAQGEVVHRAAGKNMAGSHRVTKNKLKCSGLC